VEAAVGMSGHVLSVRNLVLRRGTRVVLDNVSLDVERGEIVVLMGASGSGKTTILRAIAGLEPYDRGRIEVVDAINADEAGTDDATRRHAAVGMVFQFHCLFEHLSALENVALAPVHVHRRTVEEARQSGLDLLRQLGVEHRARALPRELSGGEAQRVAIARALATDPQVLLMDEPTASLDPERRVELAGILRDLVRRGRTLLVATHDDEFARMVGGRVLRMVDGRLTGAPNRD
jgi:ABC-type polar amino acid transport system ATPase subunit